MSAPNFAFDNILVAIEIEDEIDVDIFERETVPEIQAKLKKAFKNGESSDAYLQDNASRSYGGREIFQIDYYTSEDEHYRTLSVIHRSGYYSGVNLDYIIQESQEYEPLQGATNFLDIEISDDAEKVKKILRKFGTELLKVGQFSNGEAVYKIK